MANKKAFNLSRDSVYVADPTDDLCILGGTVIPTEDEHGNLDTDPTPDMAIRDLRRLKRPLGIPFRKNIAKRGVNTPIIIVKLGDMAVVVEGKSRVRAARAANRARAEAGDEPPIKIRCVMQRDSSPKALAATMISGNHARTDDDFVDTIEKLNSYIDTGGSEADAADLFNVTPQTIRNWLAYEDNATSETKQAVKDGRLGASAAGELARIKDPDEQREKLAVMLTAPDKKGRGVKAARAARGAKSSKGIIGKREQTGLLTHIQAMSHGTRSEKTIAFWEGAEEMLKFVLGHDDVDKRLAEAKEKMADA